MICINACTCPKVTSHWQRFGQVAQQFLLFRYFMLLCLLPGALSIASEPAFADVSSTTSIQVSAPAVDVQFHAWGGSAQVNQYLLWAAEQLLQQHNIKLNHIKLAATSDAVTRVLAEKTAGNHHNGSVDLVWINGENFAAMSQHNLLLKNWVHQLPNFALTNPENNPAMVTDFGLATQGQEAPWGKAAMVFYYNKQHLDSPPQSLPQLLQFARQYPGRFSYPLPHDFLGISFLKYALLALNPQQRQWFYQPVNNDHFAQTSQVLWQFLDQLHPLMWRRGKKQPRHASQLQRLVSDGELLLAFSFTAAEIPAAVARFDLPAEIRSYAMQDGSLGNVHFIGISYNSSVPESAKTVVNFLLSPAAQAYKQQSHIWGDDTVLDVKQLPHSQQQGFLNPQAPPSALAPTAITQLLPEPHASWTTALRKAWFQRYGERF